MFILELDTVGPQWRFVYSWTILQIIFWVRQYRFEAGSWGEPTLKESWHGFFIILKCFLRFTYSVKVFCTKKQTNKYVEKLLFSTLILTLCLKRPVLRGGSFKGTVHPKMKILSSFTHPQADPNLYECVCSAEHKGRYSEEWGKQSSSGS